MADPLTDPFTIGVIGLVIGLAILTFFEVRYVRKSMRGQRNRRARAAEQITDDAHNAVVTAKAVAASLRRGGIVTDQADSLLAEADQAMARGNYRVVLELADRAKAILKAEKARHDRMGDAARLEAIAGGEDVLTTKEQLAKEKPPNFMASKFSIGLAEEALIAGRGAGRDVAPAERILQESRLRFEAAEYDLALALALQARKVAEGGPVPAEFAPSSASAPAAEATGEALVCRSCGAPLAADDVFCRKCGTKVEP